MLVKAWRCHATTFGLYGILSVYWCCDSWLLWQELWQQHSWLRASDSAWLYSSLPFLPSSYFFSPSSLFSCSTLLSLCYLLSELVHIFLFFLLFLFLFFFCFCTQLLLDASFLPLLTLSPISSPPSLIIPLLAYYSSQLHTRCGPHSPAVGVMATPELKSKRSVIKQKVY